MRKNWTQEEDEIIRAEYARGDTLEIAAKLNRSKGSVASRAAVLGIKKSELIIRRKYKKCGERLTERNRRRGWHF